MAQKPVEGISFRELRRLRSWKKGKQCSFRPSRQPKATETLLPKIPYTRMSSPLSNITLVWE